MAGAMGQMQQGAGATRHLPLVVTNYIHEKNSYAAVRFGREQRQLSETKTPRLPLPFKKNATPNTKKGALFQGRLFG